MIRSCARRSFDAATIFIAFVICCVFFTARTRRRRSISDGIESTTQPRRARRKRGPNSLIRTRRPLSILSFIRGKELGGLPRREILREFGHGRLERALQIVVELLLLRNP